jgi:ribosomal protein S18 acetylase RimI-like enzyme
MLDYNLVSTLATYRMPRPDDLPMLVEMVGRFHVETRTGLAPGRGQLAATLKELNANRRAGSFFVFEMDEEVVGYGILANRWNNGLGGQVLHVDELYVRPGRRGRGIASDFLGLVAKVAPADAGAITITLPPGIRRAPGFLRRLGYHETPGRALEVSLERGAPST